MKVFALSLFLAVAGLFAAPVAYAEVIGGKKFEKVVYISAAADTTTKNAAGSGRDYNSPKGFFDGDLFAIPANVVVEQVYVVVDTAVAGITAFNIGDDDDADGFVASASPLGAPDDLGVTGLHYWNVDYKGDYLKGGTIVTNSLLAKFYSATGKEVKLDVTGTASAGKMRVFIQGYGVGNQ